MNTSTFTIKIENEKFGKILNETFMDGVQFKLFLKMVNGALTEKENLTFFNGTDFLINVPYDILQNSVIVTSVNDYTLADHMKSKIEALVTK